MGDEQGFLADLGLHQNMPRVSIYADDTIIFFKPTTSDMEVVSKILNIFAESSGLKVNP
jgi:hypothetical protein